MLKEASTITDIHNTSDGAEVNLVSLVTEKIPKYQLRADSVFGYHQRDWLQTPVLSPDANVDLSPELCEHTFNYFILSGDRLSQMTQTYHDIEAVTHLLEEKERDVELAARIGQALLQKNREAALVNERLEEQLESALDEISQLKHEISQKEDLLHTYTHDETDSSGAPSPVKELRRFGCGGLIGHIEGLQERIKRLEVDNGQLRHDQARYENESEALESHEQQLVSDALKELDILRQELKEARESGQLVNEELSQRNEETLKQQEEITRLLSQIVDMQRKQKQLALENEELQQHLAAANNAQSDLTREIQSLEDQYQEVANMLNETREEARLLRDCPQNRYMHMPAVPFSDSLAAELDFSSEYMLSSQPGLEGEDPSAKENSLYNNMQEGLSTNLGLGEDSRDGMRLHLRSKNALDRLVLDTARFVNTRRRASLDSQLRSQTPRRHVRPISNLLPASSSGGSSSKTNSSRDGTLSSGCWSSTPRSKQKNAITPRSSRVERLDALQATWPLTKSTGHQGSPFLELSPVQQITSFFRAHARSKTDPTEIANTDGSYHRENPERCRTEIRCATPSLGRPGIPGTEDLEKAIQKLALRRESVRYLTLERRLAQKGEQRCSNSSDRGGSDSVSTPKLRIVKPLEGSVTLNQWKYLAERDRTLPTLQQQQETRSGIITRDRVIGVLSKSVDLNSTFTTEQNKVTSTANAKLPTGKKYVTPVELTLSTSGSVISKISKNTLKVSAEGDSYFTGQSTPGRDFLDVTANPGKGFAFTSTRYTFTNSNVKHPTDESKVSNTEFLQSAIGSLAKNTLSYSARLPTTFNVASVTTNQGCKVNASFTLSENSASSRTYGTRQNSYADITRTYTVEPSLAHLLKEHSAENINNTATLPQSVNNDDELDSPSLLEADTPFFSSETTGTSVKRSEFEPVVWNKTLQRAFLLRLPLLPGNFAGNSNRGTVCAKPDTPPNSPTSFSGSAPSFHSINLPLTRTVNDSANISYNNATSSRVDDYLPKPDSDNCPSDSERSDRFAEKNVEHPERNEESSQSLPSQSDDSNGEFMIRHSTDWSELHGSSGALFVPSDVLEQSKASRD